MANLVQFLPIILMFVVFYFLLIRPQQKRQKETAAMQNALKAGDKIVTIGGFHGLVDSINEEEMTITLKSADGSRLVFDRAAVRDVKKELNK